MSELPIAGMQVEFAREVRADAASAPEMGIVILGFPGFGGRAETAHVLGDGSNLLRVTVGAAFTSEDDSSSLFR